MVRASRNCPLSPPSSQLNEKHSAERRQEVDLTKAGVLLGEHNEQGVMESKADARE